MLLLLLNLSWSPRRKKTCWYFNVELRFVVFQLLFFYSTDEWQMKKKKKCLYSTCFDFFFLMLCVNDTKRENEWRVPTNVTPTACALLNINEKQKGEWKIFFFSCFLLLLKAKISSRFSPSPSNWTLLIKCLNKLE